MSHAITEDDLYRTSTQYRFWTFAPVELASLRASTHSAAIDRAQHYLPLQTSLDNEDDTPMPDASEANSSLLDLQDEVRLVQRYAEQIRTTADFFKWPVNVKATATQYLKRFYLTNSVLTYPPKEIYKSVLFLASKTEGVHMTLGEYARRIKTSPEDVLAPEYVVIQALRFTLDVRQPFRGLRGALMEMLNMLEGASGAHTAVVDGPSGGSTPPRPSQFRMSVEALPPPDADGAPSVAVPAEYRSSWRLGSPLVDRAHAAYTAARLTLDAPALLTDAYLLFTPPQIYLAALRLADAPLTDLYLSLKVPGFPGAAAAATTTNGHADTTTTTTTTNGASDDLALELRRVLDGCAAVLLSHAASPVMTKEERAALEERLELCRDPGTRDLVGAHARAKTGGPEVEEGRREKAARQREKARGDDIFGPSISR